MLTGNPETATIPDAMFLDAVEDEDVRTVQAIFDDAIQAAQGRVPILRCFSFEEIAHGTPSERVVKLACIFALVACGIVAQVPESEERAASLRHLLEARDAVVRAYSMFGGTR